MTRTPEYGVPAESEHHVRVVRAESVAGLVLGILAVLLGFAPLVGLASGIVGLVFSAKSRKQPLERSFHGMATAGLVLSIIGIVLGGLATLGWVAALAGLNYQTTWMNLFQRAK